MVKLYANSGDPDQTPCSAASDLGLHCLPVTPLEVSQYLGQILHLNFVSERSTAFTCSIFNLYFSGEISFC